MPISFKRIEIEKERELENMVIKNPDHIEDGLTFLTHQQPISGGFIDVLCVDNDNAIVIMELKITDDEGILLQALHYYDYVLLNKAAIANQFASKAKINLNEDPRIILIAPHFSDRLRKACKHVTPMLKLVEFVHLKTSAGEKGLFFNEIPMDTEEAYSPPQPIERISEYIHFPKIREVCKDIVKTIKVEFTEIDEPKTSGRTGIKYRYKNRKIADIWVKRTFM
ncbi:MAG: DUF91 domain-containing protein, partial [Deltaproteobacteria bacterium]|nr:DUF91 domain-containing protein [Deltaproteobacteria bacterium]